MVSHHIPTSAPVLSSTTLYFYRPHARGGGKGYACSLVPREGYPLVSGSRSFNRGGVPLGLWSQILFWGSGDPGQVLEQGYPLPLARTKTGVYSSIYLRLSPSRIRPFSARQNMPRANGHVSPDRICYVAICLLRFHAGGLSWYFLCSKNPARKNNAKPMKSLRFNWIIHQYEGAFTRKVYVPSLGFSPSISETSFLVGLCPSPLIAVTISSVVMTPSPFWSNISKHSLYSVKKLQNFPKAKDDQEFKRLKKKSNTNSEQ